MLDKTWTLPILALLFWQSEGAAAESSYLCVIETAIGFAYSETASEWQASSFPVDDKYVVSKSEKYEKWVVTRIGDSIPMAFCPDGWTPQEFLICDGSRNFRMSRANLRFVLAHLLGYWLEIPGEVSKNETTPYISIGKCSPLDI